MCVSNRDGVLSIRNGNRLSNDGQNVSYIYVVFNLRDGLGIIMANCSNIQKTEFFPIA